MRLSPLGMPTPVTLLPPSRTHPASQSVAFGPVS